MNTCYDLNTDDYLCSLEKLKCLFATDVHRQYRMQRYGLKSCKIQHNVLELNDLLHLFNYIEKTDLTSFDKNTYKNKLYVEKCLLDDPCTPSYKIQTLEICNISDIVEKVNSL